jgi:tetratricopeptide (TPR) repeat protein
MKKTFLLASLIISLTLNSCTTSNGDSNSELNLSIKEGSTSFDDEDYDAAGKFFSDALLIDSSNEIALKNKIITLNKLEENEDALILAKKALALYPDSIKFKLIEARLLRILEMHEESITLYSEILDLVDFEESYHEEYIQYLNLLLPSENTFITSSAIKESNYLLENNMCVEEALIALCTIDKTSLVYSLMLKSINTDAWDKIYSQEVSDNQLEEDTKSYEIDLQSDNLSTDSNQIENDKPPINDGSSIEIPPPQDRQNN